MKSNVKKIVRRAQQSLELTSKPKIAKAFKLAKSEGIIIGTKNVMANFRTS